MVNYIVIISILLVIIFLVRLARKNSRKGESKLSAYEHPGTFKKPDIEMVSKPLNKIKEEDNSFQVKFDGPDQKTDN